MHVLRGLCPVHVSCVQCGIVAAPVILRLEELEFLLYTVQRLQDCELERLARLQGDLRRTRKESKRKEKVKRKTKTLGCACVSMCVLFFFHK